jgi:hypothetical protein
MDIVPVVEEPREMEGVVIHGANIMVIVHEMWLISPFAWALGGNFRKVEISFQQTINDIGAIILLVKFLLLNMSLFWSLFRGCARFYDLACVWWEMKEPKIYSKKNNLVAQFNICTIPMTRSLMRGSSIIFSALFLGSVQRLACPSPPSVAKKSCLCVSLPFAEMRIIANHQSNMEGLGFPEMGL